MYNGFEIKLTRRLSQLNSDTQEINPWSYQPKPK
jgi:hypothetical protein